ncbi:aminoethylphosphonate catabolism associated LysR family transcriptional regulator [Litoreibacter ascidiaceicola]|uniref:Aminoethylphosphonate catabolism associated LysR family transcriptional regulator n=1 Tax=Litoreibacter ascidiaceicola TaxID=1486859 RepID=A0A1M5BKG0_9RHOB|nr:LysR substrate-binding domain-containing protein [Litoreibacter ascidiaceicola]SHF42737.1 aminoethylphosphonate catabolism associated LysR family transcriptional regulator [Litoreibacter ascidiaceicola]
MRYSQIRAFHYVAISGGFSRAAEALSLTQPAVSEQVRKLESEYDVLLFNRNRKQVTLTSAGERLLLATKQFFEVEQQISDVLSENRTALEGTLRIIADSAFHLTHRLKVFRSKHPKVLVSVQTGNTADILTALRNYDAEIGLVGSLNPGPDMEVISLGTFQIVAFASKEFMKDPTATISIRELSKYPLIFREKGSKTRQKLEEEGLRQGVLLQPTFEVEGREAVQEIVAAGAGIGFVSEAELGRDERLITLQIDCPQLMMAESLIHLKQRSDVRLIRAFMG